MSDNIDGYDRMAKERVDRFVAEMDDYRQWSVCNDPVNDVYPGYIPLDDIVIPLNQLLREECGGLSPLMSRISTHTA